MTERSLGGTIRSKNTINLGNLLASLSESVDLANPTIAKHQIRTAYIAWEISKSANLPTELTRDLFIASLLHDTGAITIEEKTSLHNFENIDTKIHCLRGELLLKRIPEFEQISTIVKYHHTEWSEWDEPLGKNYVITSQILLLSDYMERLIDRNLYILDQTNTIIEQVKSLSGSLVHPDIIRYFLDFSKKEGFWLDLVSPRLSLLLFKYGPLRNIEIDYYKIDLISTLFRDIIDFKSPFTATHTSGVSACAEIIAKIFGFTEMEIQELKIAGNLHDLGKLAIPNYILEKKDKLTQTEFNIIKCHTYYTFDIINSISGLEHIAELAGFHHERLDGSGYPFHRNEKNLPLGSQIISVADIFTAISEDRPYRKGMSPDGIVKILKGMSDNHILNSKIVTLLIDNLKPINEYVKSIQKSAQEFYDTRLKLI